MIAVPVYRTATRTKLLLTTAVPDERTAWSKARADVCAILQRDGYATLQLPQISSPWTTARLWSRLKKELAGGGHMLIEYPFGQRRRAYLLYVLKWFVPVKLYALLHDLDSLRSDAAAWRELAVLVLFDGLISHNPSMTRWLREKGYGKKIVELSMFDYLNARPAPFHEQAMGSPLQILYAGNLKFEKARYLYRSEIGELENVRLSVFGPNFESDRASGAAVVHKGVFDPDRPVLDRRYHFGLVWEGTSLETCEGRYGRYLRYNNPHKASLYVSLGLPIVIWSAAALAEFVVDQRIGVTIDRLQELETLMDRVDNDSYLSMVNRVQALRQKVGAGGFLSSAVSYLAGD
jgi:hypothetical protein